ncbi:Kiwa anti-phage protein KwaB-like domain-containing protein [Mammaliicoccus sp. H-M34]|uniref:Kiwa anti-phage protein KwaB-like domain-containing protein n=1 Tax=Mammaliicoccus sp. H-M34 TaxID=2898693 RepID=UPI001EFAE6D4|nr:Kiwa anti-phage protein KwaB-like domain-containing protein [Mammaliicoccus sp. H-M34]
MDNDKIKNIICNGDLTLYLSKKRTIKDYKLYELKISKEISTWCKETQCDFIDKKQNCDVVDYNPVASIDNTIETLDIKDLEGFDLIKGKFTLPDHTNNLVIHNLDFQVFRFQYNNEEVVIFTRNPKIAKLDRGLMAIPEKGVYTKISIKNHITLNEHIEILIYKDKAYVYKHNIVESLFFTKEMFKEKAKSILATINEKNIISNFDKLEEDILNDGRLFKRVAKLYNENDRAELFIKEKEKTINTIEDLKLGVKYEHTDGEKIKFIYDRSNKEQKRFFTNLILDAYYKTMIGGRAGENSSF